MKRQSRVVWSKGLFLTPQLFDAQDRFFEDELQFRSSFAGFEPWGIGEIDIDETAIAQTEFRLTQCSGIFNSGLSFSFPDTQRVPLEVRFAEFFGRTQPSLDVFLTVKKRHPGERNMARAGAPPLRFVIEDEIAHDEVDAEEETIEIARPNFQIMFGGQDTAGMDTLHIARINRSGDGAVYALDPEFIPPCLNAAVSKLLWKALLPRLLGRMQFVSEQLARERSQRSELLAHFDDSDIRRFWVLDLVNAELPGLAHIHSIEHCHPEELYRALLRIRGRMCTFFRETECRPLSGYQKYDHRNLGLCLPPLIRDVERMLQNVAYRKRRCQVVSLDTMTDGRRFKTNLAKELVDRGRLYLAFIKDPYMSSGSDIQSNLKVVGPVTQAHASTLAGLQLSQQQQAPSDCPRKEGYVHFEILRPTLETVLRPERAPGGGAARPSSRDMERSVASRRAEVWQDIFDTGEIHVVVLNEMSIRQPEILVMLPETEGHTPLPDMPEPRP